MPQYQGIWTLAQAAQLQSTQRWATDPLFENTTLLLQADNAANGAQNNTFLDSSSNNFTITRNGNTTQGTFTPYSLQPGAWGNYFDGTGDFLTAVGANLALGTGDFTIEFWFYALAYSATADSSTMFDSRSGNNTTGFQIGPVYNVTNKLTVGQNISPIITADRTYPLGVWVHCAVVRSSGTITLYQDGISVGSVANTTNNTATTNYIASGYWQPSGSGQMFNGYLSNLRISNVARYTSSFTPPASAFSSDSNTRLLACQSNRFLDSSSNAYPITPYGTPSVQAFSPFAPQYQYTPSVTGGSGYFDGNGDYLTGNGILVTTTTANTFSCEGWFYPTTFANLIWLVGDMDATGGTNNVAVDISTGGAVELYWWDGAGKRCTSTSVMRLNQWNYFAIVVNAGAISIYVNSTTAGQSGTTTLTNRSAASQNFSVGAFLNSTTPNGYIGSLRWSTSARTISSIPTAPYTSDANTRLLLNFTNAAITDGTLKNNLETVGNAQVSTSVVKYGTGSMAFDGTGDYLKGVYSPNMILSGDFTIECWLYYTAHGNYGGIVSFANANTALPPTSGWAFVFYSTTDKLYFETGTGFGLQTTNAIPSGQWNHVAVVRSGSTITHYLNGVANGSGTSSATFTILTTDNFVIGIDRGLAQTMTGYLDDLRITNGIARYTGNFTPPTVALPRQ